MTTTYGSTNINTLPPAIQQNFSRKLLSIKVPKLIHQLAATKRNFPARSGNTIVLRRPNPLPPSTVPLDHKGNVPPPLAMTATDISAKIYHYGQYTPITAEAVLTNESSVLNQAVIDLSMAMRKSEDLLARQALEATSSQLDCVHGDNGDSPTNLNLTDIKDAIRSLVNSDARVIEDIINPTDKISTAGVAAAFLAFGSTNLISDLESVSGVLTVDKYSRSQEALDSEWCSISRCRFLVSSQGLVEKNASAKGENVYSIFIVGMDAYAVIRQDEVSSSLIYRPPIFSNELARKASLGYVFAQTTALTADEWAIRLRCTLKS